VRSRARGTLPAVGDVLPLKPQAGAEVESERGQPPGITARVTRDERFRTNDQFGDLGAPALGVVLQNADKGDVAQLAMLVEYAISSDTTLQSLYTSRLARVAQAEYEIVPSPYGDKALAQAAADFVREQMARIENWDEAFKLILHAIALGYSASEMEWQYDPSMRNIAGERVGGYFVRRIKFRHPRRFRYGMQWDLRLYDRGMRRGADGYGELLDPRLWIVHEHQEVAGYQGVGGVMRSCLWTWMFGRWVEKFYIQHVEKYGGPITYAKVPKDTPLAARQNILEGLQNLSADHVAVIEEGGDIVVEAAATAAESGIHDEYLKRRDDGLAKAWLGAGDAVDPGANGARGAVETRMGALTDPRMVEDGKRATSTIRGSLIKQLLSFNGHLFVVNGVAVELDEVPLPLMRMKTANDEVEVDAGAVAGDAAATVRGADQGTRDAATPGAPLDVAATITSAVLGPSATPDAGQPPTSAGPAANAAETGANVQQQALNGAQVTSLLELLQAVAAGTLPRESAVELIVAAFPVDRAQAERILGTIGQGFVPTEPEPKPSPFAPPDNAPPPKQEPPAQLSETVPRVRKRPKAPAAGEPRQQVLSAALVSGTPSRTTSPSRAIQAALGARTKSVT
jgi:phage gp29-like protein